MRTTRLRPILAALAVLAVAGFAALFSSSGGTIHVAEQSAILTAGEGPPALTTYLETAPGVELPEGPAAAADAEFQHRA
jgi:hypothetical protein